MLHNVYEECGSPLYRIVAKLSPTRFGSKKVFLSVSHVPSPTYNVFEEYVLLPAGGSCGEGDISEACLGRFSKLLGRGSQTGPSAGDA